MRRAELIAFLLAAGSAAALLLVLLIAVGQQGPTPVHPDTQGNAVYRPGAGPPDSAPPDVGPEVQILAGIASNWDARTRGLEATMRLHLWLALRDVHPTGPTLQWIPARPATRTGDPVDGACLAQELPPARSLGRNDPPLLGRSLRDRETIRVFLIVSSEIGLARYEVRVCTPGSRGTSQVFLSDVGREGPTLREMMAWLTARLKSPEVKPWFKTWSQPIAPDVAALRDYGQALAESMGDDTLPPALLEAAALLPEAAWVAAALSDDPLARRRLLERAAALRPGFTAALEDLAWEWSIAARPDLAMLTLSRLLSPERTRPSELLLAARMLEEGSPHDAARLLEELPPRWTETTAARRLEARARLASGDAEGARRAARAWTEANPGAAEAWLLRGDAERSLGEATSAEVAYGHALDRPSRLRAEVLTKWAVLHLERGRAATVVQALNEEDDAGLVESDPGLLALRAWARWRTDDVAGAAEDTVRLTELEPERVEHRRNLCVLALSAGTTEAPPEECGEPVFADLFGTLMEAVWLSRRPFRSPEEGGLLDQRVKTAAVAAPLAPSAAGAALRVLGPRATKEDLAALQARWQLARGTEPVNR
ncbi:MAG: hypothetical protein KDA24_20850 [Deltaproteobacteria bacterium]|nr:hypothetical protein [Deltaproteobacteria bacterium]